MKKLLVAVWLMLVVSAIGALFWYNQYRYSLPTPVPSNYHAVATGSRILLDKHLTVSNSKPLFLHFFNPDCPCSRFNIGHVKTLIKKYGDKANFAIVLVTSKHFTEKEIQKRFDLTIPVIQDPTLAVACGVYSTPQAVILSTHQQLLFRGNYNSSRYCTQKHTEYARLALEEVLQNKPVAINPIAAKAYGCQLEPSTEQNTYVTR